MQACEVKCYLMLVKSSYKDHITIEDVHRKIRSTICEYIV